MNDDRLKNILEDIYRLDPNLKEYEEVLSDIVGKILTAKPDIEADARFVAKLRDELMNKKIKNKLNIFSMNKIPFIAVGATAAVAVVIVVSVSLVSGRLPVNKLTGLITQKTTSDSVIQLSANAFGSLGIPSDSGSQRSALAEEGALTADAAIAPSVGFGGGGAPANSGSMMKIGEDMAISPIYYQPYQFKYTGGDFVIASGEMPVYRLALNETIGRTMARLLSGASAEFVDLSKFKNAGVRSMHISQENGFNIYMNLDQGRISLDSSRPYLMTDTVMRCDGPDCGGYEPEEYPQLPETQLISIADRFLSEYGISKTVYGQPFAEVDSMGDRFGFYYAPRLQTVVYPLSFDSKDVYESGGQASGMRVLIDAVDSEVRSVNEILNPIFEKSNYEMETDFNRIIKIVENGGMWGGYYGAMEAGETLEVGAPEYVYLHQYDYSQSDGIVRELYVPALKFPILNAEGKNIYQDSVVVPLAKEMLDNYEIQNDVPMPEPYFMKGEEGSGEVMPMDAMVESSPSAQ
ncbi:MAG: hypothetical protein A2469_00515 [Candidatus Magasanikbacteria bacterium RIFOXYC2_FULL_40_16]|uniref:Uncharacterized protein n=1 Tax=Candidatus Magasanikbacteria bacterium RIFOXYC2_FULL_40_16 TaxID=1798703 RepID=A0A1F6P1S3_9BACT|nr:MAG: hypothetical protein A2469_00515 [Candidatus Magasanikbacteria bacterium RIFOXYC2_FULL_40_16]